LGINRQSEKLWRVRFAAGGEEAAAWQTAEKVIVSPGGQHWWGAL
jgi:hypothetical protein